MLDGGPCQIAFRLDQREKARKESTQGGRRLGQSGETRTGLELVAISRLFGTCHGSDSSPQPSRAASGAAGTAGVHSIGFGSVSVRNFGSKVIRLAGIRPAAQYVTSDSFYEVR